MNEYVTHLFCAVKNIDDKYINYGHIIGFDKKIKIEEEEFFKKDIDKGLIDGKLLAYLKKENEEIEKSLESIFCYELYYLWRKIMHDHKKIYEGLMLNGEIGKVNLIKQIENYKNSKESELFKELDLIKLTENHNVFPDFTLHQGNNSIDKQKLIAEVKIKDNLTSNNFKIDFYRLAIFQKLYGFENVVFILVNLKIKDLFELLEKVDVNLVSKKNFYFILKNKENSYCFNLEEIT